MNLAELTNEVAPAAVSALTSTEYGEETDSKSPVRSVEFEWKGENFRALDQNTKKIDSRTGNLTKFAKLAIQRKVFWLIMERLNTWYLIVDGKPTRKEHVRNDGTMIENGDI